jgi:hypothetical protein
MDPKTWLSQTRPRLVPSSEHKESVRRQLAERLAVCREGPAGFAPPPAWSLARYLASVGAALALAAFCVLLRPSPAAVPIVPDPCEAAPELCADFQGRAEDRATAFLPVASFPFPSPPDFGDLQDVVNSLRERRTGVPLNGG